MTFTVTYKPSAEHELADIWINASDRQAVAAAANRIDQLLRTNPHQQGEARDENIRVLVERPLAVQFEIHDEDRWVEVLRVRWGGG
jgi:plasmid stabilization system protein ParE